MEIKMMIKENDRGWVNFLFELFIWFFIFRFVVFFNDFLIINNYYFEWELY